MNPLNEFINDIYPLPEDDVLALISTGEMITVSKSEIPIGQGHVDTHFYILTSGVMRAYVFIFSEKKRDCSSRPLGGEVRIF